MAQATVTINLAIRGLQGLQQLQQAINRLLSGQAVQNPRPFQQPTQSAVGYAQAVARLQVAQNNLSGAQRTLQGTLANINAQSLVGVRVQTQLAQVLNRINGQSQPLTGLFSNLTSQLALVSRQVPGIDRLSGSFATLAASARGLPPLILAAVTAFSGLAAGVAILSAIGEAGIRANNELEQFRLGIATTIASVSQLTSADGVRLDGLEALTAALGTADEQLRKLRVDALTTPLTFQELAQGFLQATGPGLAAGLTLDQVRKTTVALSQVIIPLTGHVEQLGQELRGLLSGDITRNTQIAKVLGITREDILTATRLGTLAEFLDQKLKIAAASGKLMARTFEAARTNLREAGNLIAATVSEGLFTRLRDKINQTLPQLFDTSTARLNQNFSGISDTLIRIFNTAGDLFGKLVDQIISGLKTFSTFLEQNRQSINIIIESASQILQLIGQMIVDMFTVGQNVGTAKNLTDAWATTLKAVAVLLAGLRETMLVIRNLAVLVGSSLVIGLLLPLRAATETIARLLSLVPGVGDFAKAIAAQVASIVSAAAGAQATAARGLIDSARNFGDTGKQVIKSINDAQTRTDKPAAGFNAFTGRIVPRARPVADDAKTKRTADNEAALRQVREAELAVSKALADRAVALAKAKQEEETRILQRQLEERQISIAQFYEELTRLQQEATQREIAGINAAIGAQQQKIVEIEVAEARRLATARKPAEREKISAESLAQRQRATAEIITLATRLSEAESKSAAETEENARRRIKATRDLQREIADIAAELQRATGDELGAALSDIDARFADVLQRATVEFGALSTQVQRILDLITALKRAARADLAGDTRIDDAELSLARQFVERDVTAGIITERQARQELINLQKAYAEQVLPKIAERIAALQKIGTVQANAEILNLERRRVEIEQLAIDTESAGQRMRRALQDGLLQILQDIGTEIRTIGDFFRELTRVILAEAKRIVAEKIVDAIFGRQNRGSQQQGGQQGGQQSIVGTIIDSVVGVFTRKKTTSTDVAAGAEGETVSNDPFAGIAEKISGFFKGFFEKIQNIFSGLLTKFSSFFGQLFGGLGGIVNKLVGFIGKAFGGLFGGGFAEGGATFQGKVPGVYDRRDDKIIRVSGNEVVLTPKQWKPITPYLKAAKVPGFERGGAVFDFASIGQGMLDAVAALSFKGFANGGAISSTSLITNNSALTNNTRNSQRGAVNLNFYQTFNSRTGQVDRRSVAQATGDAAAQLKRYLDRDD